MYVPDLRIWNQIFFFCKKRFIWPVMHGEKHYQKWIDLCRKKPAKAKGSAHWTAKGVSVSLLGVVSFVSLNISSFFTFSAVSVVFFVLLFSLFQKNLRRAFTAFFSKSRQEIKNLITGRCKWWLFKVNILTNANKHRQKTQNKPAFQNLIKWFL